MFSFLFFTKFSYNVLSAMIHTHIYFNVLLCVNKTLFHFIGISVRISDFVFYLKMKMIKWWTTVTNVMLFYFQFDCIGIGRFGRHNADHNSMCPSKVRTVYTLFYWHILHTSICNQQITFSISFRINLQQLVAFNSRTILYIFTCTNIYVTAYCI